MWSYYNYKSQRPKFCVGFEVAPFEKVKRLNKTQLDKKLSKKLTFHEVLEQGYRLTFFRQEQAGPVKQNDWELSPKQRGPGFSGKFNSF